MKWFNVRKGFGFIECEGDMEDIYVHFSGIKENPDNTFRSLGYQEDVEFEEGKAPDGRRTAVNVTGVGGAPVQGYQRRRKSSAAARERSNSSGTSRSTSRRGSNASNASGGGSNTMRRIAAVKKKKKRRGKNKTHKGTVKWFNARAGFGFIECSGDDDIYVHFSGIHADDPDNTFQTLADGEEVEFRVETTDEGRKRAVHVTGPDGTRPKGRQRRRRRGKNTEGGDKKADRVEKEGAKGKPRRRNRRRRAKKTPEK